jgi:hypothetical protein
MPPREIIESIKKARDFAMQSLRTDWAQAGSDPPADCVQRGHEATEWLRKVEECPPQEKRVVRGKGRIPTSRAIRTGHGKFPSYNCFYYIKLRRAVMTKKAATGRFPANRECRKMHFPRAGRVSSRCPWIKTLVQNVARRWTNVSACRSGHTGWVDGGTSPRRTLKAQDAHHGYGQYFGSGIHPSADQDR